MDAVSTIQLFLSSAWSDATSWFSGLLAVIALIRKVTKDADDDLDECKREALGLKQVHIDGSGTSF